MGFASEEEAERVRRLLDQYEHAIKALDAVPQLIELGKFGHELYGRWRAGRDTAALAKQQEALVEPLVVQLFGGPRGFRARLEGMRSVVHEVLDDASDTSALMQQHETLIAAQTELRAARAALIIC